MVTFSSARVCMVTFSRARMLHGDVVNVIVLHGTVSRHDGAVFKREGITW